MILDLSKIPVPQLLAIKNILIAGALTKAAVTRSPLCHEAPPAGYPKDKSQYGDESCYRYPLNTKARCLAAWRYVHQEQNKSILGDKFGSVEKKIKSYAKDKYGLDLQTSESSFSDWENCFTEFYDSETSGDGFAKFSEEIMSEKELEALQTKFEEAETKISDVEKKLSESETRLQELTTELGAQTQELETLRKFKSDTEEAAIKAEKIKNIKTKLEEAGLSGDIDAEIDYWLSMSEETLHTTINKLSTISKETKAEKVVKVPPVNSSTPEDLRKIVSEGLRARKTGKNTSEVI